MGRELKFRAWRKKMGGMFYLDKHGSMNGNSEQISLMNLLDQLDTQQGSFELEWLQFTGLKDKNGKETYHNDLAKQGPAIYQVIWNEEYAGFYLKHVGGIGWTDGMPMFNIRDCEVIGNVFENRDLL